MVSLRRRRQLGLSTGTTRNASNATRNFDQDVRTTNADSGPSSVDINIIQNKKEQTIKSEADPGCSKVSGSSSSKEERESGLQYPVPEVKRRKKHRRKPIKDREPCIMRGVYFKNMKWQAAIKVDKKQIHLGTVGSQEEAARLYDRAAFMRGREPNFELSEEEKKELRRFKWDGFLAITRDAINNKKNQRKIIAEMRRKSETSSASDGGD